MPPMTGRVIAGRYQLQSPIGRGAMGVVWRARDQLLDRDVAIKEVVISALIGAEERRNAYQRTLREARTAARLSHRGVVTVYDVVEEDARPWIVMELVPSQSLDQVLTVEGRLPTARAGRIGQQLLSALAAAHAAGVLHRDVKPSNVLIATNRTGDGWEERAVLTDFGIAQFEGDPRLTQTGMVMGSPGFTAPERIRGGDANPGSDLWSLGATIYAAVEGRGPYEQRGGAITTMSAIINEDAPVAPHAGKLAPLIAALLRRDPSARPSASAAARMFGQVLPQLTETTEEPPAMTHPATIRSAYVPLPADPVVSEPVSAAADDDQEAAAPAASPASPAPSAAEQDADAPEAVPAAVAAAGAESAAADPAEPAGAAEARPAEVSQPEPAAASAGAGASAAGASAAAEAEAPEAAPGDAAAEQPAAAAAVGSGLASEGAAETGSRSDETVTGDKDSLGYQPTQLSIPVARSGSAAPAEPKTALPQPVPPKPVPPKPAAKPGPTFTAAKPADRAAPSFSAGTPVRPARPVTPPDQRQAPGTGSGGAGSGGAGSSGAGSSGAGSGGAGPAGYQGAGSASPLPPGGATYPAPGGYGPPGGQYPPSSGQYAGPSQPYQDLGRQYTPGSGGGRDGRPVRTKRIAWLAAAVVAAAAIGVGAALALHGNSSNGGTADPGTSSAAVPDTPSGLQSVDALNNPTTAVPVGWRPVALQASDLNSTAGFSLDLPPGWTETRKGLATDFTGPGDLLVEVDTTPQQTTDMLAAATTLEHQRVTVANAFPGYKRDTLKSVPVRNTEGAVWKFTWTPPGHPQNVADDILFRKQTSAGAQDYAIYIRSPSSTFGNTSLPLFVQILRTFQTIPATTTQPPVTASPSKSG